MNKVLWIVLAVVIIGGGIWWWSMSRTDKMDNNTAAEDMTSSSDSTSLGADISAGTDSSDVIPTIPEVGQSSVAVAIAGMAYSPKTITIKRGTAITWTNNDTVAHTVTADDMTKAAIDSPSIAAGKTFSYTFAKTGTFTYHCKFHPQMKATVTVIE